MYIKCDTIKIRCNYKYLKRDENTFQYYVQFQKYRARKIF